MPRFASQKLKWKLILIPGCHKLRRKHGLLVSGDTLAILVDEADLSKEL